MRRRVVVPEGWAELWADGGAIRPLRTYVVQIEVPGISRVALGTVVAPTAAAAVTVARGRWPIVRHQMRAHPVGLRGIARLVDALVRDGAALLDEERRC